MEIIQLVRAISTDMECPQCKRGRMRPLGIIMVNCLPITHISVLHVGLNVSMTKPILRLSR